MLVAAALARVIYLFEIHPLKKFLFSDMSNYVRIAGALRDGHFHPFQLFQPVGFPLLIAGLMHIGNEMFWLSCLHLVASMATLIFMWRGSVRWLGSTPGLFVLILGALHTPLLVLNGFALAETLFTLPLALVFYLMSDPQWHERKHSWAAIGFLLFLASWFKGTHAFVAPLLAAWFALLCWKNWQWRRLSGALMPFVLGAFLAYAPYLIMTTKVWGFTQWSPAAGGLNFVEGKCPSKDNSDPTGARWFSPLFLQLGENQHKKWDVPFTNGAYYWQAGMNCIKERPMVLLESFRYIYYLFYGNELWPQLPGGWYARIHAFYTLFLKWCIFPAAFLGIALMMRRWRESSFALVVPIVAVALCVWFFKSEIRFRIPYDCFVIPLSVFGWMKIRELIIGGYFAARNRGSSKNKRAIVHLG